MIFQHLTVMHKMHGSDPLGGGRMGDACGPIGPGGGAWRLDKTRPGGVYAPDFQPLEFET